MFGFTSWYDFTQKASQEIKKAGTKAKDLSSKISSDVNTFVAEQKKQYSQLNDESELKKRQKLKQNKILSTGNPPWIIDISNNEENETDINHEIFDELKLNILKICEEPKNFLIEAPKSESVFDFKLECALPYATCVLKLDPILPKIRFKLVPQRVSEEQFWRNYFYRIQVIRESMGISRLVLSSFPLCSSSDSTLISNNKEIECNTIEKHSSNTDENSICTNNKESSVSNHSSHELLANMDKDITLDDDIMIVTVANDDIDDDDDFYSDEVHIDSLSDAQRLKMKQELGLDVNATVVNNVLCVVQNELDDDDENVDELLADINVDDVSDISDGEIENMVESESI